ncbi:hypothetical protein [Microbacterium sp.]|uniref:hypothetical protein n=1 Tax=Microbacterium sp. TaxID=51671 RepID=UPI002810BEE9|nr:hypothetical protein [Microbacterium sp.]
MTDEVRTITAYNEFPTVPERVRIARQIVTITPAESVPGRAWLITWPQGFSALVVDAGYDGADRIVDYEFDSHSGQVGHGSMVTFDELAHQLFGGAVPLR